MPRTEPEPITPVGEYELQLLNLITAETVLKADDVAFERMDHKECPEHYIYITDKNSWLRIAITTERKTAKSRYVIEWPHRFPGDDGQFVERHYAKIKDAVLHFEFGVLML